MKQSPYALVALVVLLAGTVKLSAQNNGEQPVQVSSVPSAVIDSAKAAVPGVTLSSAATEREDGALVYSLVGTQHDQRVEIELSANGKVLEIERGAEDDNAPELEGNERRDD